WFVPSKVTPFAPWISSTEGTAPPGATKSSNVPSLLQVGRAPVGSPVASRSTSTAEYDFGSHNPSAAAKKQADLALKLRARKPREERRTTFFLIVRFIGWFFGNWRAWHFHHAAHWDKLDSTVC